MMSETEKKTIYYFEKRKQMRTENPVCKLSLVFSTARCYVFLGLPSRSNVTAGLEPYPRKTLKKRVFAPLRNGDTFLIENHGMPTRGPRVFAGKTKPLGSGTIVLDCGERPASSPDQE